MSGQVQPIRVIIRGVSDFLVRAIQASARPHDGDILETVIFATIQNANLSLLAHSGSTARGVFDAMDRLMDDQLRLVSVNAIAKSFAIPYETARGAVGRLIRCGCCVKANGGVIVPVAVLSRRDIAEAEAQVAAILNDTLSRLGGVGLDLHQIAAMGSPINATPTERAAKPPTRQISWIATDFALRTVESLCPIFGDFTAAFIFAGVMSANTKDITYHPQQAWAYAGMNTPPPDSMRKPVSIRNLSEQLGVPFETTRRHVNRLVKDGDLLRLDGGVIAPTAVMQSERFLAVLPLIALRFTRLIADLTRAGYRFPNPNADVVSAKRAGSG